MFAGGDARDPKDISLETIKHDIETSYKFFQQNYRRYHDFYDFVFRSSISSQDIEKLKDLGKPPIEANILRALIGRVKGEFAKQKPMLDAHPSEGMRLDKMSPVNQRLIKVIQAHLNEILLEQSNDDFQYDVFSDLLAGGFSTAKVYADYVNSRSFLQNLYIERCFNPTMCGFDPLARQSHKGDGRYAFELSPMTREEFAAEYGNDKAKEFYYTRAIQSFNWSYQNNEEKIVLIGDFYVKVPKNETLCLLADGQTITERDYNKMLKGWDSIEQPPIVLQRRKTMVESIDRYRICENEILEYTSTSYPMLPLVFFDGDSVWLQNEQGGQMQQFCRPYIYDAKGAQQLKNFAMQSIGAELEDFVQHKFMVPLAAIPQDPHYREAFTRPQIANTLAYLHVDSERPDMPLPPPQVIQRPEVPRLLPETYLNMDNTVQTVMGTYDGVLGINGKDISGKAIQMGALQSNAAVMPYIKSYLKGLQRCGEIILHMIPQYYNTPRSIPIRLSNGKRDWVMINDPNDESSIDFNYDPHDLNIKIEPGVNAEVQKQLAVEQLTAVADKFEKFKMFMNDAGIPTLLDNLDIHGAVGLKDSFEEWDAQMKQQPPQPSPVELEAATIKEVEGMKTMQRQMEAEQKHAIQAAEVAIAKQRADVEAARLAAEIGSKYTNEMLNHEREDAKIAQAATEFAAQHALQVAQMEAQINQSQQNLPTE